MDGVQVRRLTPRECERLQGFADDYTLIPTHRARVKERDWLDLARYFGTTVSDIARNGLTSDSARYKALGNSMPVPVMRWIGRRIDQVCAILNSRAAA